MLYLGRVAHIDRAHIQPDRGCDRLYDGKLADPSGYGWVPKNRGPLHVWRNLLEQFHPFPAQTIFELNEAGDIAARPSHALHKSGANRVGNAYEYDRDRACRLQQRRHGNITRSKDDVW